jgi:hypothetical protein
MYTLIAKTPIMFHVRPPVQKRDTYACCVMEFTTTKNNSGCLRKLITKTEKSNDVKNTWFLVVGYNFCSKLFVCLKMW